MPNCRSNPSFVVCSIGGVITPPLLKRTSSRVSLLNDDEPPFGVTWVVPILNCAPEEFRHGAFDRLQICEVQMQGQRYFPGLFAQVFDSFCDSVRVASRDVDLRIVV